MTNKNEIWKTATITWGTYVLPFLSFFQVFFEGLITSLLHVIHPFYAQPFGNGHFISVARNCRKIEGSEARVTRRENLTPLVYKREPLDPRVVYIFWYEGLHFCASFDLRLHFFSLHISICNSFKMKVF